MKSACTFQALLVSHGRPARVAMRPRHPINDEQNPSRRQHDVQPWPPSPATAMSHNCSSASSILSREPTAASECTNLDRTVQRSDVPDFSSSPQHVSNSHRQCVEQRTRSHALGPPCLGFFSQHPRTLEFSRTACTEAAGVCSGTAFPATGSNTYILPYPGCSRAHGKHTVCVW